MLSEAATRGVSWKNMFLEIHKIPGKTSVPESIFDELQAWGNFIKKETLA